MKKRGGKIFHLFWILFLTAGFFILPKNTRADAHIVINEIMIGEKNNSKNEFIELYNPTNDPINLEGYKLKKETDLDKFYYLVNPSGFKGKIPSKGYFLIASPDYFSVVSADLAYSNKSNSLASGNAVILYDKEDKIVDKVGFGLAKDFEGSLPATSPSDGESIERKEIGKDTDDNNKNFEIKKEPSPRNSSYGVIPEKESEPKKYSDEIKINEVFPNPKGKDDSEFIELYNCSKEKVDLSGYILKDSSKNGKYEIPNGTEIKPNGYFLIYKEKFKFALNNSNETIYLFNPNKKEIDRMNYVESAKENISYNFDGQKWHWSRFLTPGNENRFNNLPTSKLKIEKKVYKNMLAEFRVSAKDKDKDKLKFVWDFGDEHKSYKRNTKHKYLKKGVYQVSLKISDGSEDIFKTFEIEVGKFPKSELKIVSVNANPKGKDMKLEAIGIKNNSKKKINLKGWSIATGWKNLYNHPITKKFVLKPGETKELTREYSLFSLNNKQTKIELRYPDGKIASKVKYSKKEGIQNDETYEKTENGWEWVEMRTDADEIRTSAEDTLESPENTVPEQNAENDNQDNAEENKSEEKIQENEPEQVEGEILGAETVKNYENISGDKPVSGNFFQRIFWNTNKFINNLINLLF